MENMNNRHELKEAIDTIAELARQPLEEGSKLDTVRFYGRPYSYRDGRLLPVPKPNVETPSRIQVSSLEGLIKLVQDEGVHISIPDVEDWGPDDDCPQSSYAPRLFVEVEDHRNVIVYTDNLNSEQKHFQLYLTSCPDGDFRAGHAYTHEKMMIALRSMFQATPDRDYLLQLLSSVTNEAQVTSTDNGLNQQVTVNKGIANIQRERVKSIVSLKPYRTFPEVEQPESEFLVRLSTDEEGGIQVTLHPADGDMWKLTAMRTIREYLGEALSEEIGSNAVTVL